MMEKFEIKLCNQCRNYQLEKTRQLIWNWIFFLKTAKKINKVQFDLSSSDFGIVLWQTALTTLMTSNRFTVLSHLVDKCKKNSNFFQTWMCRSSTVARTAVVEFSIWATAKQGRVCFCSKELRRICSTGEFRRDDSDDWHDVTFGSVSVDIAQDGRRFMASSDGIGKSRYSICSNQKPGLFTMSRLNSTVGRINAGKTD